MPHPGIVYFHWWRLTDRFASRAFVEALKDPQRLINRRKTQNLEIIDRGMPKLIVRQGDWPGTTTGAPLEVIELSKSAAPPQPMQGFGPGQWIYQDIEALDADLRHASTLTDPTLGENPSNVGTYSQLALLHDSDQGKRATIRMEHRQAIADLVELSLVDVERYWPEQKTAMIIGDDGAMRRMTFEKSKIPAEYRVRVPAGSALPRTQGAELKKVDAIWAAMLQSGLVTTDPARYVGWYQQSLEAGSAVDLPVEEPSTQEQLAEFENLLMRGGQYVPPTYYDVLQVHLPIHRTAEDEARAAGDAQLASILEQHIQAHQAMERANLQAQQLRQQSAQLGAPGGPPPISPQGPPGQGGPPPGAQRNGGGQPTVFANQDFQRLAQGQ
jgi:hypothetical protein